MSAVLVALGHDPQTAGLMHGMVLAMVVLLTTPAALVGVAAWWLWRSRRATGSTLSPDKS